MVKICLHCGDKGFPNALVHCVNCLQYAVHRYCLNELPATFDEFVHWICDDCEVVMPQHFGSLKTEPIQLENGDYMNSKHGEPSLKEGSSKRKKTGDLVLDTADNLLQHQSPDDDFPSRMNSRKKVKKDAREFSSGTFTKKLENFPIEKACQGYTENKLNDYVDSANLENRHGSPLKAGNRMKHEMKNVENMQVRTPPEHHEFGLGHLSDNGTFCNYELAQPLADPIWRGSFNILNREYDEFEGMVAHLSKKACQKAYEEARLFPTLLDLEMYPKLDVWPKSFERSEPSDDSIALYFFPTHKRYERMFDHLVEQMMNDELAMRAILENAELLIFTSGELPLNYWRFQGKYYLWGVFRGKQPPLRFSTIV